MINEMFLILKLLMSLFWMDVFITLHLMLLIFHNLFVFGENVLMLVTSTMKMKYATAKLFTLHCEYYNFRKAVFVILS